MEMIDSSSPLDDTAPEATAPREYCVEITGTNIGMKYGMFDLEAAIKEIAKVRKARPSDKVLLARWDDQDVTQPNIPKPEPKSKAKAKTAAKTKKTETPESPPEA